MSGDEVFGALGRKALSKHCSTRIEAQMTENHSLHRRRRQAKHRLIGLEHRARMRLEGQNDCRRHPQAWKFPWRAPARPGDRDARRRKLPIATTPPLSSPANR
jgi:hypothetical protein